MRLLTLSDLHLDLWRDRVPDIDVSRSRPDLVILAGDIHEGGQAVAWAAEVFAEIPVVYVHGNHEPYGTTIQYAQRATADACNLYPNIRFLDCTEHVQGDVRVLGCTLWTDFQLFDRSGEGRARLIAMTAAERALNDYRLIKNEFDEQAIRAQDTAALHAKQLDWLTRSLEKPFAGKTVVVTHMAPSFRSVAPQYEDDLVSAAFASNLDDLADQVDVWIHGHMHSSFDYLIGKCRVVCNPRGYRLTTGEPENPDFDPNFIVEV